MELSESPVFLFLKMELEKNKINFLKRNIIRITLIMVDQIRGHFFKLLDPATQGSSTDTNHNKFEKQLSLNASFSTGWRWLLALELWFAEGERDVSISYHVLDLSFHGDAEECDEVHDENWPEDGYVEEIKEGAGERDHRRLGGRVPELEFWQSPDEWPEFVVLFCGEAGHVLGLGLCGLELCVGRVDLGGQEGQQEVQVVDGQRVGHDVPSLFEYDAQHERRDNNDGKNPTGHGVRGPPV